MSRRGLYRGVYSSLIDDPDYQRLSSDARLVLLTVRLCAQAGAAAIFRVYPAVVAEQTGLTPGQVEAALGELEKSPAPERPWIFREAGIVWVRNALRYDPNIRLADDKHRKAIERAVAGLPSLPIVRKFCRYYQITSPFADPGKGLRRPSRDHSPPNTETEEETEEETESRGRSSGSPNGQPSHAHDSGLGLKEEEL